MIVAKSVSSLRHINAQNSNAVLRHCFVRFVELCNLWVPLCNIEIAHVQFANPWPKSDANAKPDPNPNPIIVTVAKLRSAAWKLRSSIKCARRHDITGWAKNVSPYIYIGAYFLAHSVYQQSSAVCYICHATMTSCCRSQPGFRHLRMTL